MAFFRKRNAKMAEIQADEQRRKRSGHFAIFSIVLDVVALACAFGGVWLFLYGIEHFVDLAIIIALFPIGIGIGLAIGSFVVLIWSLVMVITQFAINRSAWSWIALILFLGTVAGAGFIILYILGMVKTGGA